MPYRSPLLRLLLLLLTCAAAHAQAFQQPTVIPTGNWPAAIYTADVNNDGFPDLIYIDQGAQPGQPSTTHVLVNDGKGHFTQTATVATIGNSLAVGGFFGLGGSGFSGTLAWATPTSSGLTVYIAAAQGNGTYAPTRALTAMYPTGRVPLPMPNTPTLNYLTAGMNSVNGASQYRPFLFAQDTANNIIYQVAFLSDGTAALSAGPLPDGTGPASVTGSISSGIVTTPDFGVLVVEGLAGSAAQIFSSGVNLSGPTSRFTGTSGIRSFILQDVNFDGFPDLIAEGSNGHLDVFFGNGDGTFQTTSSGGTGTLDGRTGNGGHLIAVADLNHDGLPDALASTPAGVSSLLGQGTAYLGLKGIANAGPGMHTFATADFNGDGTLDLATDSPEGIAILFGNADGTFQTSPAYAAGQPALSGALGQFTSSGHLDAMLSTGASQSQLLLGDGSGVLTPVGGASSPTPTTAEAGPAGLWSSVLAVDANNDGKLDLVITADGASNPASGGTPIPATGDGMLYQLGNGDGTFQPLSSFGAVPPGPSRLYGTSVVQYVGIPQGLGTIIANLGQQGAYLFESGNGYLGFAEQDQHAHNLILEGEIQPTTLINQRGHNLIIQDEGSLLLGDPNALSPVFIEGDLHRDGSLTTPGQLIAPDISASFPGPSQALGFRAFPGSGVIADLDRDGNGDVLMLYANLDANRAAPVAAAPNYLYLWFGSGDRKFLTSAAHPVNPVRIQLSRNYYQVAVADLNGDGIPDLILSDGYLVSVQHGLGDGTFGPEAHLLAGQGINSLLLADVNGDGLMDLITANGGAVLSNPVANLEVLATNPDVNTGGITVLLNAPAPKATAVTGTLSVAPNPVGFEAGYTFTVTLTPPPGGPTPTGMVVFNVPGITGTIVVTLVNGIATLTVPPYPHGLPLAVKPGTYTATAQYDGDLNYAPLNNLTTTLTVNLAPTSVLLTPTTPLQTQYGGPVDGTFAITVQDAAYPTTGTGTVYDNGVAVPICTHLPILNQGTAVFCPYGNPVLLDAGTHALQVGYDGDPINAPSISPAVVYVISPDPTTLTNLTSSAPVATLGQPVTFAATVTGTLAVPTGPVTFYYAPLTHALIVPLGTGTLNSAGVATLTISSSILGLGTFQITASYAGNQDFNPSSAGPLTQIVVVAAAPVGSSVSLTSSVNPSLPAQPVTLTATVSITTLHPPVATGTITFYDSTTVLATQSLNNVGQASFTTATLTSGSHPLTAAYSGASGVTPIAGPTPPRPPGNPRATAGAPLNVAPSVSPVLTQIVNYALRPEPAGFTINVSPVPVTLGVGRTAVLLVQVTPVSGFAQPVALSCGSLPYEATCVFGQTTIPAGGGATTVSLATEAPHNCGEPGSPYFLGKLDGPKRSLKVFAAMFLPALTLVGFLRRRRLRLLARDLTLLALTCAAVSSASGCGRCTDLGTGAGTFSITVVGSAVGGPVSQTQSVPVQLTTHY